MLMEDPILVCESDLPRLLRRAKGWISNIYLHWTGGHYGQVYDDYHFCIDRDGQVYATGRDLRELKSHTWHRNCGAIGIALCCGYDAACQLPRSCEGYRAKTAYEDPEDARPDSAGINLGPEPPTPVQIEVMAKLVALICMGLGLAITPITVATHCEVAFRDGYGPGDGDPDMRWDLWFLPDDANGGRLAQGGWLLRGKAAYYRQEAEEND